MEPQARAELQSIAYNQKLIWRKKIQLKTFTIKLLAAEYIPSSFKEAQKTKMAS